MTYFHLSKIIFRDQEAILEDIRVDLATQFEFFFSPPHVEVISGKQEGIYSWIAINYALGKFDHHINGELSLNRNLTQFNTFIFATVSLC